MDTLGRRARGASSSLLGCLWAALAAWLWIGAAAPLDGLSRLAAAGDADSLISADRGHAHDPAREPPAAVADASEEFEPELEDDEAIGDHPRGVAADEAASHGLAGGAIESRACPRDPSVEQRHNRGPPRA